MPNALSGLRLLALPLLAWLILDDHELLALALLVASGASDGLDGYLARRWGQVTRLGQLLDPIADRLHILVVLLGLAVRHLLPWWLVLALLARDVVLAVSAPVLARAGYGPLPVHHLGKAATFCLLCAFPLLLLSTVDGPVGHVALVVGWASTWWGSALYWWAALLYLRQVREVTAGSRARAAR